MGISKTNLGISIESIKNFIAGKIPNSHNVIAGRDSTDAHPISAITGLQTEVDKVNSISVAQKTVNQKHLQCLAGVIDGQAFTPTVNLLIPFTPTVNNGIDYDETTKMYKLKANTTYNIEALIRLISYQGYMYYTLYDYTNSKVLGKAGVCEANVGVNQAIIPSLCVITPNTDINVGVRVTVIGGTQTGAKLQNTSYMNIQEVERTIIDPVEYVNVDKGLEDTPVGHILSFMGATPPSHYVTCDGAIYNITDYPFLAQHIKDQFGSFNYFGGDGISTFAVPDLRNEFLRGYHADKAEKLSDDIGIHQNPTENIFLYTGNSKIAFTSNYNSADQFPSNMDSIIQGTNKTGWLVNSSTQNWSSTGIGKYTARPSNVAVLYCIKYEPTYFMSIQGLIEETTLWEGNIGTNSTTQVSRSINLIASVMEYDEIGFYYQASIGSAERLDYNSFPSKRFKDLIESPLSDIHISLNWGQSPHISFADIDKTSSYSNLNFLMYQSYVTKVVGIKYKTFQN